MPVSLNSQAGLRQQNEIMAKLIAATYGYVYSR